MSSDYKMFTNLCISALFDEYDIPPKFYITTQEVIFYYCQFYQLLTH